MSSYRGSNGSHGASMFFHSTPPSVQQGQERHWSSSTINEQGTPDHHQGLQTTSLPAVSSAVHLFSKSASTIYPSGSSNAGASAALGKTPLADLSRRVGSLKEGLVQVVAPYPSSSPIEPMTTHLGDHAMMQSNASALHPPQGASASLLGHTNARSNIVMDPYQRHPPPSASRTAAELFRTPSSDTLQETSSRPSIPSQDHHRSHVRNMSIGSASDLFSKVVTNFDERDDAIQSQQNSFHDGPSANQTIESRPMTPTQVEEEEEVLAVVVASSSSSPKSCHPSGSMISTEEFQGADAQVSQGFGSSIASTPSRFTHSVLNHGSDTTSKGSLPRFQKPRLPSPRRTTRDYTTLSHELKLAPLPAKQMLLLPTPKRRPSIPTNDINHIDESSSPTKSVASLGSAKSGFSSSGMFRVPPPMHIHLSKKGGMHDEVATQMHGISTSHVSNSTEKVWDYAKSSTTLHDNNHSVVPSSDQPTNITSNRSTSSLLPPGWIELTAPDSGRKYYLNAETRETTWDVPVSHSHVVNEFDSDSSSSQPQVTKINSKPHILDGDTIHSNKHSLTVNHFSVSGNVLESSNDTSNKIITELSSPILVVEPQEVAKVKTPKLCDDSEISSPEGLNDFGKGIYSLTLNPASAQSQKDQSDFPVDAQVMTEMMNEGISDENVNLYSPEECVSHKTMTEPFVDNSFPSEYHSNDILSIEVRSEPKEIAKVLVEATIDEIISASTSCLEEQKIVEGSNFESAIEHQISWVEPEEISQQKNASDLPDGWIQLTDEASGNFFYFNKIDQVSQWDFPSDMPINDNTSLDINPDEAFACHDHDSDMIPVESPSVQLQSYSNTEHKDIINDEIMSNLSADASVDRDYFKTNHTEVEYIQPVWIEAVDEQTGRKFYFNEDENITQWEKPDVDHIRTQHENSESVPESNVEASEIGLTELYVGGTLVQQDIFHSDDPVLAEGWIEAIDEDSGKVYYFNESMNITQWDKPGECKRYSDISSRLVTTADVIVDEISDENGNRSLPTGWVQIFDQSSGASYFYNESENITQWENPANDKITISECNSFRTDSIYDSESNHKDVVVRDEDLDEQIYAAANQRYSIEVTVESIGVSGHEKRELPSGWVELLDESSGLPYYFHEADRVTQWEKPTSNTLPCETKETSNSANMSVMNADGELSLPSGWEILHDDTTGRPYYFNQEKNTTQWDWPKIVKKESDTEVRFRSINDGGKMVSRSQEDHNNESRSFSDFSSVKDHNDDPLPFGWKAIKDPASGQIYYLNVSKNLTTWDRPKLDEIVSPPISSEHFRPRPAHALSAFAFGGRLVVMKPQIAERLGYGRVSEGKPCLRRGPVVILRISSIIKSEYLPLKNEMECHAPLISDCDDNINIFLDSKCGNNTSDGELLWNLISIASKWKGRLRGVEGISKPDGPEAAVIELLLKSDDVLPVSLLKTPSVIHSDTLNGLDTIQKLLLRGRRDEAVKCALSSGNHGLALMIACICGPDMYHAATTYIIKKELTPGTPLYTASLLFAEQIQSMNDRNEDMNFWEGMSEQLVDTWRLHLATILSNQTRGWKKVVISLGDQLLYCGKTDAAHFCYLISGCPISSTINPSTRIALVGCDHRVSLNSELLSKESIDAFFRTEALEWAKRKGNPQAVITAFQPFKLKYAILLADHGLEDLALLYVESLRKYTGSHLMENENIKFSSISNPNSNLSEMLEIFEDRLYASLGLINHRLEKKRHSSIFGLSGVLSKIVPSSKNVESPVQSALNIDGSFDDNVDHNDSFISASSNMLKTSTTVISTKQLLDTEPSREMSETIVKSTHYESQTTLNDFQPASQLNQPTESLESHLTSEGESVHDIPSALHHSEPLISLASHSTNIKDSGTSTTLHVSKTMSTPITKKAVPEAPSSGSSWSIGNWLTKKLNPDATQADIGGAMEAYYDKELKRWVFPGDDLTEISKPLAPPPTTPVVKDPSTLGSQQVSNDPLASLLAPPTRMTPNVSIVSSLKAPSLRRMPSPAGSRTPISGPPQIPRRTQVSGMSANNSNITAPHFVIFQPNSIKENEDKL